jgi:hypothetical protein
MNPYSCFISNNVPALVQEQRDLLQNLLEERQTGHQNLRQEDKTSDHKHDPKNHQSILKNQSSRDSVDSLGSSEGQLRAHIATEGNTSIELREYNILIQSMLDEIESCKSKLEKDRHSRIRDGVLNIHSGEITRFQIEHGPSIYIDHSLFAYVRLSSFLLM